MKIIITIEDIIKRCLWTKYQRFVLKDLTKDEIIKLIEENKPTAISENDAFVIGLLKTIETDDLVHRFRLYIEDFLKVKSTINNDKVIINKSSILKEMIEFKDMFPVAYKPNAEYQASIDEMKQYVVDVYDKIENFDVIQIDVHDKIYTYVLSSNIQKLIKR